MSASAQSNSGFMPNMSMGLGSGVDGFNFVLDQATIDLLNGAAAATDPQSAHHMRMFDTSAMAPSAMQVTEQQQPPQQAATYSSYMAAFGQNNPAPTAMGMDYDRVPHHVTPVTPLSMESQGSMSTPDTPLPAGHAGSVPRRWPMWRTVSEEEFKEKNQKR
jgi:hypothetical protein